MGWVISILGCQYLCDILFLPSTERDFSIFVSADTKVTSKSPLSGITENTQTGISLPIAAIAGIGII